MPSSACVFHVPLLLSCPTRRSSDLLPFAALLAVVALPLLTGAFHEDGLGDTADGLGGAFEKKRKLEIMRDSRIGTYGTVALLSLFLRSEEHTSELQSRGHLVCRLLLASSTSLCSSPALHDALPIFCRLLRCWPWLRFRFSPVLFTKMA